MGKMQTVRLLITGASGFVGCYLLEKLIEGGSYEIAALHNRVLGEGAKQRFGNSVRWLKADITRDDLTEAVAEVDTVFHLAAYSSIGKSQEERNRMERVNVFGTERLAAGCKKAGVRHFIFVSSIAACEAGRTLEINESNGFPVSSYGKTKKSAEDLLLAMQGNGLEVTVLRPTALFGEHHLGSVYELVRTINGGRFVIFGRGENRTNFYYIRDFIDVLVAVQNDARAYGQVFITADKPYPLQELVAYIARVSEYKHTVPHIPAFWGTQ